MLKIGDKLLCKKTYHHVHYKKVEGKYYIIDNISYDDVYVCLDHDWYSLDPNRNWYIWKYFYKPQEVRKMKLKQLNDIKSR